MTIPPDNIGGLLLYSSNYWGPGQITFSIPQMSSIWSYTDEPGVGYGVLSTSQIDRFIAAIAAWDRLIAPNMVQTDDLVTPGQIRVAFTDYSEIQAYWGYAYTPPILGSFGGSKNGDIWINRDYINSVFAAGGYDFSAMLHEIGHALGLTHPHDVAAFPAAWDGGEWTVMSYKDDYGRLLKTFSPDVVGLRGLNTGVYTATPMVLDIQAIQQRYGADPDTAVGNDTYTFTPGAAFMRAIYDAGGLDTIDISNLTRGSIVDLAPGAYSSIGQFSIADQIAAAIATYGAANANYIIGFLESPQTYTWTNNFGISFSSVIENAIGGAGGDTISGNQVANTLEGRGGADILTGLAGNDILFGGAGNDRLSGGLDNDILFGDAGDDTGVFDFIFAQGGVVPFGSGLFVGGEGLNFIADLEVLIFNDGTIDRRDADPTIDDLYYYGVYKDVWNAKVDADAHYKTGGWREGRNPSQWFDTNAYLAAYADARDAAAQGMDPLTHYLTIGWKKNYDPSTLFDTSSYLAAYTDVAAAGINPLVHYMTLGIDEFRLTFGDGSMIP